MSSDQRVEGELEQRARERTSTIIHELAAEELQQVYDITLHQDSALDALIDIEPTRDRVLLQAAILLAISSSLLLAALMALYRSQSPYSLPKTAHFVAFLPEEYAAEIGALHHRMKKAKASDWEIRLRLCEEFISLLWVFYIQIRLNNLTLPFGDRSIDE